jgi:hypothetical protein
MYVPLYTARGVLTAPLRKDGRILSVDSALHNLLVGLNDNYTYLKLEGEAGVEIVKAYGVETGVYLKRAQDSTEALEFNIGDTVGYTLTAAEIADSVPAIPLTLQVTGGLRRIVDIEYIPLKWTAFGATEFVGAYPDLVIGRDEEAYGCCDGNNEPARLPAEPFYLTSRPYPIEVIEGWTASFSPVRGTIRGTNFDLWQSQFSWQSGILRQILKAYDNYPPENWQATFSWQSGTLRQILKSYNDYPPEYWQAQFSWRSGTLRQILISYTNYPPESWQSQFSWVSGTLV